LKSGRWAAQSDGLARAVDCGVHGARPGEAIFLQVSLSLSTFAPVRQPESSCVPENCEGNHPAATGNNRMTRSHFQ
jgi:hypothetical protein